MSNLFYIDRWDFFAINRLISFVFISISFLFLAMCSFQCTLQSDFPDEKVKKSTSNTLTWNAIFACACELMLLFSFLLYLIRGHAMALLVEALHYNPECRGFVSRYCHWKFFIDIFLPAALWLWVRLRLFFRIEYQEYFLGGGVKAAVTYGCLYHINPLTPNDPYMVVPHR